MKNPVWFPVTDFSLSVVSLVSAPMLIISIECEKSLKFLYTGLN